MRAFITLLLVAAPSAALAQDALLVYRLGKDTLAVEQFTRNATGMSGEMVQRTAGAVISFTYAITLVKRDPTQREGVPAGAALERA